MQMPTINSQNCFWVAYLFIHSFLCWWQRGKASAIEDVFNMSHTMSAWGSSQLPPPPGTAAQLQGQDTQPPLQEGVAFGMWRVPWWVGHGPLPVGQWVSSTVEIPSRPPEKLREITPRLVTHRGHYWTLSNMATSHRSHWRMDLGLLLLTASGKMNVLIPRVSFFQWTFPCWAAISISCCHRAETCYLWDPSFLALSMMNLTF